MNRIYALLLKLLLVIGFAHALEATAQVRYWVGGSGHWADAAHWSATAAGVGGAGVPGEDDAVVVIAEAPLDIDINGRVGCASLAVDARSASVRFQGGADAELEIAGAWSSHGDVSLEGTWPVRLTVRRKGVELDLRGTSIGGDVILDGSGSWSVISDLDIHGDLRLRQGTLIANAALVKADRVVAEAPGRGRIIAGRSFWDLAERPSDPVLLELQRPTTTVAVGGMLLAAASAQRAADDRDINVCGTDPGQTPFTVNAQVVTNYNGYGVQCRGDCNATVTVTATGGSGDFSYLWLNGGPHTPTWTSACGGPQLVVVTDNVQGISCPVQVNVSEPAPIGVIFFGQGTPPTCADVCNGSRTALAIGGVTPATYNWNNGAGTSSTFSQLCAGVNTLRIQDANACTFDTTFTFNVQPISPNLTFTNTSCFGDCDGTAQVAPTGGTGGFTITWTPPPVGQGTPSVTGLCAGNHSVRIADANGCDTTVTFTITQPPAINVAVTATPASCAGGCNGTASVAASGIAGPYTFQWAPAPGGGQNTNAATGLCEGAYTVRVTDVPSGCDTLITVNITAPPPFDVQAAVTDATCANSCDGTIVVSAMGGTPGYTYVWSPVPVVGQGTANISGLCPGVRTLIMTDQAGCDTTVNFTVGAPPPLLAQLSVQDVSCAGACDGTATVTASGGTGAFSYLWTPAPAMGQGTAHASGLCPGPGTLLVTDASGCDTTITFIINEPTPLTATSASTDVSCGSACDGTASVVVSGGTPGYTYLWSPAPGTGQGTANATGFCAGPVNVLITDANGCTHTVPFVIADAVPLQFSLQQTPVSCPGVCDATAGVIVSGGVPGYTYAWSPAPGAGQGTSTATGLCAQAYSLRVTDAAGCDSTISFTITAPPAIVPTATPTDVTCAGACDGAITLAPTGGNGTYTYQWTPTPPSGQGTASATQLCAGSWSVRITSGGCDTTLVIDLQEPLPITTDLVTTDASCPGACDGTATVTAAGGTGAFSYLWTPAPATGQGTAHASGLCPGPRTLTVTDASGCDTTITFNINEPTPLTATLTTTPESCVGPCTGSAVLVIAGGTGAITIDWQPAPGAGQGTTTATGLCAGTAYTVTLADDNGCTTAMPFQIDPSSVITPNSSSTSVTCNGSCDGTATVGPTGGTQPYTYLWSPPPPIGQGTPSVAGLCAGVVQVTITDATGCGVVADVLITAPPPMITDVTIVEPRCAGTCDGSILLDTNGGVGGYTFTWSPPPPSGQGTNAISGLCAGTWNVAITDGSGCALSASYTLTEPPPITGSVSATPSQCQVCIGEVSAVFHGGVDPLAIVWTNALGAVVGTTDTVSALCAGLYTATITDANGCTSAWIAPVTDSDGEEITAMDGTTSCPNTCDGVVSANYACADPVCQIVWTDGDGNVLATGVDTLAGLCPGPYFVTVTNASGCVTIDTAMVVAPVVVTLQVSSSPVSCAGECDGTAAVGVADGTPPYVFFWDPAPPTGQGTPAVSGLCAGVHEVSVRDGNGCETVAEVLITEPQPIDLFSSIVINTSCATSCDGNITLIATGGSGDYSYQWTPAPMTGQGSSAAFGFCAGNVSVTITDLNGCTLQRTFVITSPQPLSVSASSTQSTCPNCDGTATALVAGGTGTYTYSWMLGGTEVATDQVATGLCGGVYVVTVRDDHGCSAQATVPVTDSNAEVLDVVDGHTLCANACDGAVEVVFTCGTAPCTIQWTDDNGVVLGQDPQLSGLCVGGYTVQVTNGAGCVSLATATVGTSTEIIPQITSVPETCTGSCDGTATVGPQGGVAPYTYVWTPDPGAGQGTPQATGLCAGVYEVLIADASGCDTTAQVLILAPIPITATAVITDATCFGACDGSIIVTTTGGTGAHDYTWSPVPSNGQGSNGAFGLCAGTYELTVTDANGCASVFTYTIVEPVQLALAGGSAPSLCGACSGEATVSASGGTGSYTYLWTLAGAIHGTNDTLQNVCAGLYHVLVTDQAGCTASLVVPVQDMTGEVLTTLADTTSCPGVCDGTAEVQLSCGTPTCVVAWYDAAGNDLGLSTQQVTAMCGGTYLVMVTNGIGCVSIDTAFVAEPDPIIPALSTTPVTCYGDCDGSATVGPTGGVAPYTYAWVPQPTTGQGTPHAEGFCAGTAEVTIGDAAGCSIVVPFLILGPDQLVATADPIPITCSGACDGTIVVTAAGGTGAHSYTWDPVPPNGQGSNAATGLCPGTWVCVVADANGCSTTVSVTLVEPPLLLVDITTTDNQCFAECVATAALNISGGVAPHTVVWMTADGTPFATDTTIVYQLCAGSYTARVTDTNGCFSDVPFTINEGAPIEANLVFTGETCAGPCDGTAAVAPTGGVGPFTISWQPTGFTGDQVSGLCAGDHTVNVIDALGCDTTVTFTLLPYTPITDNAVVSDIRCAGSCDGGVAVTAAGGLGAYTFTWSPVPPNGQGDPMATSLCPGVYGLVIADATGCDSAFTYTINEPPALVFTVNTLTDASCADALDGAIATTAFGGVPPYTFAWSGPNGFAATTEDLNGLASGSYHLLLTDANNCIIDTTITVGALVAVIADAGLDQQACSGTHIMLDGSASTGAVSWSWRDANGVEIGNAPTLTVPPMTAGDHVFTLIVSNGPCTDSDEVTVSWMPLPIADAGPDHTIFRSETVTLGGDPTGPLGSSFLWAPDSVLSDATASNPIAHPTVSTWFTLTVSAPNGCVDTDSVLVTVVPTVVISNGITPNGDGKNDTWVIDFIELFPKCEVEIYNRWGELLFRSVGYDRPWDGRYRDGPVPVGTYYYVIELNDERFPEPYTGPLTVIR